MQRVLARSRALLSIVAAVVLGGVVPVSAGQQEPQTTRWSLGVRLFYPGQVYVGVPVSTSEGDIGCSSFARAGCEPLAARLSALAAQLPTRVPSSGRDSRSAIPGFTIDAGMMIAKRVEMGLGLDVSTYGVESTRQLTATSYTDRTTQLLDTRAADERWLQLDLVGRLKYMGREQSTSRTPGITPYVGIGGGLSRYAILSVTQYAGGAFYNPLSSASGVEPAISGWFPNLQVSTGAQFKLDGIPLFDLEFRYVWLATNMIDTSGFRLGAGLRYKF